MSRVHPTVTHVLLAMAATTATAGLLVALHAWWLAPAVAAAALSPFVEWTRVPAPLVRTLPALAKLGLFLAFVSVWFSRPLPVLAESASWLPIAFGTLLAALAALFALARGTFAPQRTLLPALLGLMVVAGADPAPEGFGISLVPAFRAAGHNAFADAYVALALLVVAPLWAATLVASGPSWRGRAPAAVAGLAASGLALAAAGVVWLPTVQPRVERALVAAFDPPSTGLSGESVLGEFAELAVSRRRVLDLRASEAAGAHWLLRSEVLTQFDGRRWTNGPPPAARGELLVPVDAPAQALPIVADLGAWFALPGSGPAGRGQLRIKQHALESWPLLLPQRVALVSADARYLDFDGLRFVRREPGSSLVLYGALLSSSLPPSTLARADAAAALALPPLLDPRLRALAARLGAGSSGADDAIERTLRHLHTHYRYTLQPGRFRAGGDPVAEFLFEKKQGYCEYFATAATLLLRLQGVPARFVKGLSVGPQDDHGGGLFVVRESDAHAWVEAYVEGEGWREIDPTPPGSIAAVQVGPGPIESAVERLRAALGEAWARVTGPGIASLARWLGRSLAWLGHELALSPLVLPSLLLVLAALALARALPRRLRDRQRRRAARAGAAVSGELLAALEELERCWSRAGRPRPASRGLREHVEALAIVAPHGAPRAVLQAGPALVELYYRARYGGEPPPASVVAALRQTLRRARNSRTGAPARS